MFGVGEVTLAPASPSWPGKPRLPGAPCKHRRLSVNVHQKVLHQFNISRLKQMSLDVFVVKYNPDELISLSFRRQCQNATFNISWMTYSLSGRSDWSSSSRFSSSTSLSFFTRRARGTLWTKWTKLSLWSCLTFEAGKTRVTLKMSR